MKDETRRKIDKAVKIGLIVAGLFLICNDLYWRWNSRSSADTDNNVNQTVESIQRTNKTVRSKVESGRREIEAAEEHFDRTVDAVERSEETARSNARSADELQTLISECRGIIESQRSIIQEVDRANGIRPKAGEQN